MRDAKASEVVNQLIRLAKVFDVRNATFLIADGLAGREFGKAVAEIVHHGTPTQQQAFKLALYSGALAMGKDPDQYGLKFVAYWSGEDELFIKNLCEWADAQTS